jgi:hypothetical protein
VFSLRRAIAQRMHTRPMIKARDGIRRPLHLNRAR